MRRFVGLTLRPRPEKQGASGAMPGSSPCATGEWRAALCQPDARRSGRAKSGGTAEGAASFPESLPPLKGRPEPVQTNAPCALTADQPDLDSRQEAEVSPQGCGYDRGGLCAGQVKAYGLPRSA